MKLSFIFLNILMVCVVFGQSQKVDDFDVTGHKVTVYFFDPVLSFIAKNPSYQQLQPKEKSQAWYRNLMQAAVYMFKIDPSADDSSLYFIVRGDTTVVNSARFYRIQTVSAAGFELTDPNQQNYESHVVSSISFQGARGGYFEHSLPEDKRRELAGNGFALFPGQFVYCNAYIQIKTAASEIIRTYLEDHSK